MRQLGCYQRGERLSVIDEWVFSQDKYISIAMPTSQLTIGTLIRSIRTSQKVQKIRVIDERLIVQGERIATTMITSQLTIGALIRDINF